MSNYKKLHTVFAGTVMAALVFTATPVQAQTIESLQAMIQQLQAQIAQLMGGQTTGGTTAGYQFTRDLTIGSQGNDVAELQRFLVSRGHLVMPAGVAYGYFGPLTQSALARYQAASGIAPAAGYFGPITRAHVNAQGVVSQPTTPPTTTPSTPGTSLQGGAGDITVTERSSGVEDEVLEGEEDVKVLGFEVEADGSDIAVTSVRVEFVHEGSGSRRLDRYADEVSIMMNNKVVGSARVRDFTESRNTYSRNIPVTNAIVREDDRVRFYVAVSAARNVDTRDIGQDWEVGLGQIRFEDATGAILTDNTGNGVVAGGSSGSISELFSFEDLASSGNILLTVREDDEQVNRSRTVQVDESSDTNDVEILSFTLEARGSDITVDGMMFSLTSSGAGVTEIANDFRLLMDDDEVGRVIVDRDCDGGNDGFSQNTDDDLCVRVIDLDDDDVVIEEGDTVSFMLVADINDIDGAFTNGDSLAASLDADDIDAEDENGDQIDASDLRGTVASEDIRFAATGIMISDVRKTSDRLFNLSNTSEDDQGEYTIEFRVTAFEDTAYIALSGEVGTSTNPATAGAYVYVEDTNNNPQFAGDTLVTVERVSGGSLTSNGQYVRVNPGQSAVLRAVVLYNAATSGNYRAQLHAVNFNDTQAAGDTQQLALPEADFQTPSVQVLN